MRQIIYVWNYLEWGGAQVYFMSLMKEARKTYRVTALVPANSDAKLLQYLTALEIPVEFLPAALSIRDRRGRISRRLAMLRSENELVRNILARKGLADTIFHIDLGFWQSSLALVSLCMKTNVFTTVHTGLPLYRGWRAWRWALKGRLLSRFKSFHLLASNREAKDSLRPYIGARKFAETEVTYSGINPDELIEAIKGAPAKTDIRAHYQLPDDKPIIMTVGQFIERKGCWVLLESLKRLKAAGETFRFVWMSTTPPERKILARINSYALGDSFRLMGAGEIGETRRELLSLLSSADVFVLASLQEGLPIALIEAMALGIPCIATSVNAIPEAIDHGKNGMLVPPNDPMSLQGAIAALLADPEQREIFAAAGKKTAFEKFNAKITAERTVKLYDQVWKSQG